MERIGDIPEMIGFDARRNLIRIPDQIDIPITPRVRKLIDTSAFRRLSRISQLGLVSLVYPAAHHTRFEHSLGVYRLALLYLKQLAHDNRFAEVIRGGDAQLLVAAALLHDVGHWPFCHAIEDMDLPGVPEHERLAESLVVDGEIAEILRSDWGIEPREVVALLSGKRDDDPTRILQSILSGPIDIDKMDYLERDSLHAGVPYGRNYDQHRLIGSLCLNRAGDGLAISDKGRTAAEMMVFARYVMFSEVYWHHAVRSATAMLQRAFYLLHRDLDLDRLFRHTEDDMVRELLRASEDGASRELVHGLFGPRRRLYKQLAQYSYFEQREIYECLARRPYPWLVGCAEEFVVTIARHAGRTVEPWEVIFDAPPAKLEVEFNIEIYFRKEGRYRVLGDVSPVLQTLARQQFDDYVKRVRIFVHPRLADDLRSLASIDEAVLKTVERLD